MTLTAIFAVHIEKMGRSKNKPLLEKLIIEDVAAEGKSIAKFEGMVIFVPYCAPGDVVDVQVTRKRSRFMEGIPVRFHSYSAIRSEPFCSHFGVCGGCKWQHLPYSLQLKLKQQQVTDALQRIGKLPVKLVLPIVPSENQVHYRNKLEFTFTDNRWLTSDEIHSSGEFPERRGLGFHIPGKFDKVLDISKCYLQPDPSNEIRDFVREYALVNNLPFFNLLKQEGLLRNLIIRNNADSEIMLVFSFFRNDGEVINSLLSAVAGRFPQVKSIMLAINSKANDTLQDIPVTRFSGHDCLTEKMEDLVFRISPKSFFQTNTQQAYKLYCIVRDFAGLSGRETVYDLYTGTGTIALFLARHCKRVIGLEYVEEAIEDAKSNAALNQISNAEFYAGDIRDLLRTSFFNEKGIPDVLITDPPRNGMHADVIEAIVQARPGRIVYVSCNPATQARDLEMLSPHYQLLKTQPVDMFPFTQHVENVALLEAIPDAS